MFSSLSSQTPSDVFAGATHMELGRNLDTITSTLQVELVELKEVITTIEQTHRAAKSTMRSAAPLPSSSRALVQPLTPRELEVLHLIAEGLVISIGTVKSYTSQIYGKLNVSSRTQAVARARELKLLS